MSASLTATIECGPYRRTVPLLGTAEPAVTRAAFLALAALVDDLSVDVDQLDEFVALTVDSTGQLWVYSSELFLQNLIRRAGDQTRARHALDRLVFPDTQ